MSTIMEDILVAEKAASDALEVTKKEANDVILGAQNEGVAMLELVKKEADVLFAKKEQELLAENEKKMSTFEGEVRQKFSQKKSIIVKKIPEATERLMKSMLSV